MGYAVQYRRSVFIHTETAVLKRDACRILLRAFFRGIQDVHLCPRRTAALDGLPPAARLVDVTEPALWNPAASVARKGNGHAQDDPHRDG